MASAGRERSAVGEGGTRVGGGREGLCAIAVADAPRLVLPLSMWPKMPTLTFSTRLSPMVMTEVARRRPRRARRRGK